MVYDLGDLIGKVVGREVHVMPNFSGHPHKR